MRKNYIILSLFFILTSMIFCAEKEILFLSTQLNPVEEANAMRNIILKDFDKKVEFKPYSDREVFAYLSESAGDKPDLIGGIYGDFSVLKEKGLIQKIDNIITKNNIKIIPKFLEMSKMDTDSSYFIPWMQATYVMVANKKALKYLPKSANLNNLTYEDLIKWGENISKETGKNRIGFPVGKNGLWHRFLQGYLYPSYLGDMTKNIDTAANEKMWSDFKRIWKSVDSESLTYSKMDTPLLSESVWIAWDHTARIIDVFKEKSDEFVAFPAPIGPKGRGYMMVLAGVGVTDKNIEKTNTERLIKYLLSEKTQILTMDTVGFFPVIEIAKNENLKFKEIYNAVIYQSKNKGGIVSMPPVGLGEKAADFNSSYLRAFSQIVLRDKEVKPIMEEQDKKIKEIFAEIK